MTSMSEVIVGYQFTWLPVGTTGLPIWPWWGRKFHFLVEINDNNNIEIYQGPLYLLPRNHTFIQFSHFIEAGTVVIALVMYRKPPYL